MAKKYIEFDALITCMEENCDTWKNDDMRRGFRECARIVFDMPAADVVEVVRCKDCKHNPNEAWFGCPAAHLSNKQRPEDAWCWRGERKDA